MHFPTKLLYQNPFSRTKKKSLDVKDLASFIFPLAVLGYYGNIHLLTDHFLDLYQQSQAYRKQAAMVLNEIIRGAAGITVATVGAVRGQPTTQEDLKAAVVSVMEEYTSLENWHLMTVSEETDRDRQDQQARASFRPLVWVLERRK